MSLKSAAHYLYPGVVCQFNDVDPSAMVSWDVDKATSESVLNSIANQINADWSYQNKVLFFSKRLDSNAVGAGSQTPAQSVSEVATAAPSQPTKIVSQPSAISQHIKSDVVKEVIVDNTSTSTNTSSLVTTKPSLKANEEVVEWVVKAADSPAANPTNQAVKFEITGEDETLSLALRRWTSVHGYQLAWEAGKDFSARKTTYDTTDLISAIEAVMNDTAHSNYPLHACVYDNKVIRVLQMSQGCGKTNSEDQH